MMRTRVKICGITNVKDALLAVAAGCDAIGLVFYKPSPRYVLPEVAAKIAAAIPPFVSVVGLFVNAARDEIDQILKQVHLDIIQFHGDESPEDCEQVGRPYIKAVRVKSDTNLIQYASDYTRARALLLDTFVDGHPGGTGQAFDWGVIPNELPIPIILAGGLNQDNVAQAIRRVKPYAVDVSGGVEKNKGVKDADKIAAFMRGVSDAVI